MQMEDIKLWVWYVLAMGNHKALARKLYQNAGSVEKIYEYTRSDYEKLGVTDERKLEDLCDKSFDKAEREMWFAEKYGVEFISIDSENYPRLLKNIYDPPLVIYKRGVHFNPNEELCIAVVGTRKPSEYGRNIALKLSRDLAAAGITVVSGMAEGIDSCGHIGCLEAGGNTIAVLGKGVNKASPASNTELMRRILNGGAVISEYSFDEYGYPGNFHARNRIISGMCMGTVVVEAGEKSGSLITANYALDQGRDVFAVPSNVGGLNSAGVNELLKGSAKMVTEVRDILEEYETIYPHLIKTGLFNEMEVEFTIPKNTHVETNIEKAVLENLKFGPRKADVLAAEIRVPISQLNGILTMMELMGDIRQNKYGEYILTK